MSIKHHLFSQNEWATVAARQRALLEEELSNMPGDQLLNTAVHDLSIYFAAKYRITIPTLLKEQISVEQQDAQIEVVKEGGKGGLKTPGAESSPDRARYSSERARPFLVMGTRVEVTLPFEGDAACFDSQPTTLAFNPPRGEVDGNTLIFHVEGVGLLPEQVRAQIQQTLADITQNLKHLRIDTERFNGNLYSYSHALIAQRRRKLLTDRNLVAALGYKLKTRDDSPLPEVAPTPRPLALQPPTASTLPYQPEPILAAKEYAYILETLQQSASMLAHSPSLFATFSEETLRGHILIHLNARFASESDGEAFAHEGSSTIALQVESRDIFMAECKVWSSPFALVATLNHLLMRGSWRDAKAAILLFHHTAQGAPPFATTLATVEETVKNHSNFKRELLQLSESGFTYVFAQNHLGHSDPNREMLLTVLAFELAVAG